MSLEAKAQQIALIMQHKMTVKIEPVKLGDQRHGDSRTRYFVEARFRGTNIVRDVGNFDNYSCALRRQQEIYDGDYLVDTYGVSV